MAKLKLSFPVLWRLLGGPELTPEFRFHPVRRWRFDYAVPDKMLAVEYEGGTWSGGAHNRGRHFLEDCQKYNAATAMGWRVYRLGTGMVTPEHVQPIIDSLRK